VPGRATLNLACLATLLLSQPSPAQKSGDVSAVAAVEHEETLANAAVAATLEVAGGHLRILAVEDRLDHTSMPLNEAFVLVLKDGREIPSSFLQVRYPLRFSEIPPDYKSSRAADRGPGHQVCTDLSDAHFSGSVHWCMISREGTSYLRQELTLVSSGEKLPLSDIQLFRFRDPVAQQVGTAPGSPIISGNFFLGFEHPSSYCSVSNGDVVCGLKRTLPLEAGQSITYSSVIGVAHRGQMRRAFLAYIEQERAHPYRTFLHYNTWYDLGYGERYDAEGVLNRMNAFGKELVQQRGVRMDSFLLDDGWDNTHSGWEMNSGFPNGFVPLKSRAAKYGFGIGVWMSPWGGYQKEKDERIAYGKEHGYEIVGGGYALSGPRYYKIFEATCSNFIRNSGVNQFKFDGTGNAGQVFPGSLFDSDFAAAIHLILQLRAQDPNVYINLTTGTKPSPFWLRYVDSIWRSGEDNDFIGEGSWRQRWITYRDAQTYKNIVVAGPLFPLNSVMLHGLIYAQKAEHLADDPNHDFATEVHSYFGSGTQLQEMYITPSLLSESDWDVLAESAKWSRRNASILRDTHWIGGDPAKEEVYGWASWNAGDGILVLRNPSARPQAIAIDVQDAFELPAEARQTYTMHSPWKSDISKGTVTLRTHQAHRFELQPFEVLTLESLSDAPTRDQEKN
jgi:hypothetical protein